MKPKSFFDLPTLLQESLLWDMELRYDSYDSSMDVCVREIMSGNIRDGNHNVIESSFNFMSESFLVDRAKSIKEEYLQKMVALDNFILSA
jgi:hypothetical protein